MYRPEFGGFFFNTNIIISGFTTVISTYVYMIDNITKHGVLPLYVIPVFGRLRQDDCHLYEASLSYTASSRPVKYMAR